VEKAIEWLSKSAEQGDASGQTCLALCYEVGPGVTQDYKESIKWYTKAAEQGDSFAQANLGRCYVDGTGVLKDENEAVKWLAKSAEQGSAYGQNILGGCYQRGIGVMKDEQKAVKWYTKSADQGNATGQRELGNCYAAGKGVTKDEKEAVKWWTKSAETGDVYAQNNLAWVLSTSSDSNIRNGKEAGRWAQKAIATRGLTDAFALDTLAATFAEQGDFAVAVSTQEKAISILTKQDASISKTLDDHLKSYQAKKPWRDSGSPEKKSN
jgi:TPR repeat protein